MRFRAIATQFALLALLAAIPSFLVWLLTSTSPARSTATAVAFVAALLVALAGALGKVYFQQYTDRPLLRIEHVDFKSERQPFRMDPELWWFLSHSSLKDFFPRNSKEDLSYALLQNEFQHFHLRSLEEAANSAASSYDRTSRWTSTLLERLKAYGDAPSDDDRESLLQDLSPYVVSFQSFYREANKGSLYHDLRQKPKDAIAFLESELEGLLTKHDRDLSHFRALYSWVSGLLPQGPNNPKSIDHAAQSVPRIRMAIGLMNLGQTAALFRAHADLMFEGKLIPFKSTRAQGSLDYGEVESRRVNPFWLEIDKPGCAFQDQKLLYEALTAPGARHRCSVRLLLPDGSYVERANVQLVDNGDLRI
ncbi:MAG: hypothetical protein U0X73_05945 [Thermoanaerobaculia bacterium]